MLKTVSKPASLRPEPLADAEPIMPLSRGDALEDLGQQKNGFSQVKHPVATGWVRTDLLIDFAPAPVLEPISPDKLAEVAYSAGKCFEIPPAFLLALSVIASNMTNMVSKGVDGQPDTFGVFQFSLDEWSEYVKVFAQSEVRVDQIGDPAAQCLLVSEMTKGCVDAFNKPGGLEKQTMAQVFLAHLLGANGADAVIQLAKASPDESMPIDRALMGVCNDQSKVDRILKRRAEFFMKGQTPATLKQALDAVAARVDAVTEKANGLVDSFFKSFPEEKPVLREAEPAIVPGPRAPITVLPSSPFSSELEVALKDRYAQAAIIPSRRAEIDQITNRMIVNREIYDAVERETNVPWFFVGILHIRESNAKLNTYLGNGQRLDRRTTIVPIGRGPFSTFKEGAIDALKYQGFIGIKNWTLGFILDRMERFNGLGYRNKGIASPYVWGGTDQYVRGKYVADHKFDANFPDPQVGGAAIMKVLNITI